MHRKFSKFKQIENHKTSYRRKQREVVFHWNMSHITLKMWDSDQQIHGDPVVKLLNEYYSCTHTVSSFVYYLWKLY